MTAILGQYLATIFRTVFWFLKLSPEKKIHAYKKRRTITFRAVCFCYKQREQKNNILLCEEAIHTIPTDMWNKTKIIMIHNDVILCLEKKLTLFFLWNHSAKLISCARAIYYIVIVQLNQMQTEERSHQKISKKNENHVITILLPHNHVISSVQSKPI